MVNCILSGHKLMCPFSHLDSFSVCFHQSIRRTRSFPWQNDLFEESLRAAGISGIEIGTRLYVSNLDYGVTNEDIRVQLKPYVFILSAFCRGFFLKIGELKRYAVHYDKNGRPTVRIYV